MNETIQAISNVGTTIAVIIAASQLYLTHRQSVTSFEDTLNREYRALAATLPPEAFYGEELAAEVFERKRDEFYRYFDLTNEQIYLRQSGRVSKHAWVYWRDGIRTNLERAAFAHAWEKISKLAKNDFKELRKLIAENFANDPRNWH